MPTEISKGATHTNLEHIHSILNDSRYEGHYATTLVNIGEWGPPFGNAKVDLLPDRERRGEYGILFGRNINDDNEVGASLIPARIWDMTRADLSPDFHSYFQIGEWPVNDYLPLFKGTAGIMGSQALGLRKAIGNVFIMLNKLESEELSAIYPHNPALNLIATGSDDGKKVAVISWFHPNIKKYEKDGVVEYSDLISSLERDGIRPVAVTLHFTNLIPGASYTQSLSVVDASHSNAFEYGYAVMESLKENCGKDPDNWQRVCIYNQIEEINNWTLAEDGASVALETVDTTVTANANGEADVTFVMRPYSVWLATLKLVDAQ